MDGARGGFTMNREPIRRKTRTPGLDSDGCGDLGWSGGSERSAAASARAGAARFELKWIEPRQASSSSLVSPESIARRTPSLVSTHEKSPPARPPPLTPSAAPNFCPSPPPRPATPSVLLSGRPQSTPVDRTRRPNPTFFPVVDCSSCRFQSPWRRLVVREAKCVRNFNGHRIPAVGFSPFFQHDSPEKKPRISTARRLRPDSNLTVEQSSTSSMSSRSNSKRIPSGDNVASDGGLRRREIYLNGPSLERASKRITEGVLSPPSSKNSNKSKGSNQLHSEASASTRKSESSHRIHVSTGNDDLSTTQKPRKVKLKIGGISRTIPTKPNPDIPGSRSSAAKPTQPGDSWHRQKHGNQTESAKDKGRLPSSQDKKTKKLRTIDTLTPEQPARVQSESSSDPVRKSRRIAKKSTFDSEFDEEYDSSTLEASNVIEGRVRDSRNKGGSNSKNNASKKDGSRSTVYKADNDFVTPQSNRDGNKRLRDSTAADVDDTEEEPVSDSELESENKKQKAVTELPSNVKSEPLTTRRRALQSWMDGNSNSTVEFPDGLPAASSRSKKEKLSEAEVLAKKAEAAQRRKLQVEKASKESEAEAIRKILGLDTEKKKEERKQKEREEKEKAARAQELARNSIRWVMGPTGTVVSFPDGVGLPSIFNSKPCSYPPPREKCAGPSCTNVYRYRDSKLKLPLCSLECYKAVRGNA